MSARGVVLRKETYYSIKLSRKCISSHFRNVNQAILHQSKVYLQLLWHFLFLPFALRFQWGHLPQKIVCGSWVFGKTPCEGSPDLNHKRHVSKQFNFLFVMWVTRVTGMLVVAVVVLLKSHENEILKLCVI